VDGRLSCTWCGSRYLARASIKNVDHIGPRVRLGEALHRRRLLSSIIQKQL
jgi:hypothetical protein